MSQPNAAQADLRSDRIPQPYLQEALETVAANNGFELPQYDVRIGTKAGDNYGSLIYRVGIRDAKDSSRTLSVMLKSPLSTANNAKIAKLYHKVFSNEVNAYNMVLSTYAKRLQERGLLDKSAQYPGVPQCFLASLSEGDDCQDVVILEDMRPVGFVMHDSRKVADLHHCRLVLGFLANLHASSLAMEHLHPGQFQRLRSLPQEVFQEGEDVLKFFDKRRLTKLVLDMIEKRYPEGSPLYIKAKAYCDIAQQDFLKLIAPLPDGGNVICHGDSWLNNLLFKYSDCGRPERVCFLDFQITRFASPALDVAHFLFSSTDKTLRDAHLDSLLRHDYHAVLQGRLRALGVLDADAVFSWQRFQTHFQQRSRYGLVMAFLVIPGLTVERDQVPDLTAKLQEGSDFVETSEKSGRDTTERDRRMSDLFLDMEERGFI